MGVPRGINHNNYCGWGSRDGAVVRALASHQCGSGSIPRLNVICGLSLLLVLVPAPRVFSGFSGFPPSTKTNIPIFQFDLVTVDERASLWKPLKIPIYLFNFKKRTSKFSVLCAILSFVLVREFFKLLVKIRITEYFKELGQMQ